MNDEEGEKVDIKQEEVFEVEQTPLFSTRAFSYYQQHPPAKRLNHKSVSKSPFISCGRSHRSWIRSIKSTMTRLER